MCTYIYAYIKLNHIDVYWKPTQYYKFNYNFLKRGKKIKKRQRDNVDLLL